MADDTNTRWITVTEAATRFAVTAGYIRRLAKDTTINARKTGRSWQIDETSARQFFVTNRAGNTDIDSLEALLDNSVQPRVLLAELEGLRRENELLRTHLARTESERDDYATAIAALITRHTHTGK